MLIIFFHSYIFSFSSAIAYSQNLFCTDGRNLLRTAGRN